MRSLFTLLVLAVAVQGMAQDSPSTKPQLKVSQCADFEVTGSGTAEAWKQAEWVPLQVRPKSAHNYASRIKMLYSPQGIYVLFDGEDKRITATKTADNLDLWTEDVYECFFWTDERHPIYFEYEISPLGFELPILVPNIDGKFLGWTPWHIGKPNPVRLTRKATAGEVGRSRARLRSLAGQRRCSFPMRSSVPWAMFLPNQAPSGAAIFIAWTTTMVSRALGIGLASVTAFMTTIRLV